MSTLFLTHLNKLNINNFFILTKNWEEEESGDGSTEVTLKTT